MAPGEFRCRVCYAKRGRLRLLSHLEVGRAIERGVRRAALPYAVTQGFNPHMKIAFGPALPVGTAGMREYFDVWLTTYVPAEEFNTRYSRAMPVDLAPVRIAYVGAKEPSLTASCTIGEYEVGVTGEVDAAERLGKALDDIVAGGQFAVEHKGKSKVFDLASSLPKGVEVESSESGIIVKMTTLMGPQGSLRPDVLVNAALSRGEAIGAVTFVTRRDLLICDEKGNRRPI